MNHIIGSERGGYRTWGISRNGESIQHMFDFMGSETFDPTDAKTVVTGSGEHVISVGDVFEFRLHDIED